MYVVVGRGLQSEWFFARAIVYTDVPWNYLAMARRKWKGFGGGGNDFCPTISVFGSRLQTATRPYFFLPVLVVTLVLPHYDPDRRLGGLRGGVGEGGGGGSIDVQ